MSLHKEITLETEICAHLADHGWHHAEGDAARYDRTRALYPPDLVAWVQESQPKAWETLVKQQGSAAEATLLDRITPPACGTVAVPHSHWAPGCRGGWRSGERHLISTGRQPGAARY